MCTHTDPASLRPELDDDRKRCMVPIGKSIEVSELRHCPHSTTTQSQSAAPIVLKNCVMLERGGDGEGMVTEDRRRGDVFSRV